jgi:hypothetical protein
MDPLHPALVTIVLDTLKSWGPWATVTIILGYLWYSERKEHSSTRLMLQASFRDRLEDAKGYLELTKNNTEAATTRKEADGRMVSVLENIVGRINVLLDRFGERRP